MTKDWDRVELKQVYHRYKYTDQSKGKYCSYQSLLQDAQMACARV